MLKNGGQLTATACYRAAVKRISRPDKRIFLLCEVKPSSGNILVTRTIVTKTAYRKSPISTVQPGIKVPSATVDHLENFTTKDEIIQFKSNEKEEWNIDFTNTANSYRSKSMQELIRASFVLKLCTVDKLVDYNLELANLGQKILGQNLFKYVMKNTFYGQFVAGENEEEIKPCIQKMQSYGVGSILDYAVEEDLSEEEAKDLEMSSCVSHVDNSQTGGIHLLNYFFRVFKTSGGAVTNEGWKSDNIGEHIHGTGYNKFKAHREFGDRRHKVVSARTYFYTDEAKCDENMKMFMKCIDAAGSTTEGGFAAIKLTALGRPQFLLQFSDALMRANELFNKLSLKNVDVLEKGFDIHRFRKKAKSIGILMSRDDSRKWFTWMDTDESGFVDLLDWNQLISSNKKFSEIFVVPNPQTGEMESLLTDMTDEEDAQMRRMLRRMDVLARRAESQGVRLMVDAEQTYFQPAISRITVEMMRRFNKTRPVIFNTYQCYLKAAFNYITVDLALAQREGFHFGCKLVRGAYMEQERERANMLKYEDPIQPDYEATNRGYLKSLDLLLDNINSHGNINVMVASHNEDSIKYALQRMHDLGISSASKQVFFGQLLGMCDHVTYPLGQAGHCVFKYVPFGPVREVMPYLSRRAQENRGMLRGAQLERQMLWQEIMRRLFGFLTPKVVKS
uniref:proline dehydrogenase 1, mitochondrial-like isoform X1 n=1 Tax=Styela clava TaxID=7725 RepID=UPI00193A38AE|nr:proline dehydrogenase 1, mitochondrial-like isoform X1 [Styela clava]